MPSTISYQQWQTALMRIPPFKRSPQLQKLTTSFEQYSRQQTHQKLANLEQDFAAWELATTPDVKQEIRTLTNEFRDLEFTIGRANSHSTVGASSALPPVGYTITPWNAVAQPWTRAVVTDIEGPLDKLQITALNEAFRRVKSAVTAARDAMLKVSSQQGGGALPFEVRTYIDYFGPIDQARVSRVLENFTVLQMALQLGPNIVDLRDTEYGKTCYAACFRNNRGARNAKGAMTLTGRVDMFLGRAFFKGGGYAASTDNTVGTLVHEFAHGAINAVDAPPVEAGVWKRTPNHLGNPAHADYGESPQNSIQASTPQKDKDLAAFAPDIAIRNADNYGQYAKECLINLKG